VSGWQWGRGADLAEIICMRMRDSVPDFHAAARPAPDTQTPMRTQARPASPHQSSCYKVLACSRRTPHDWKTCPFVHPGEHGRRRPLAVANYRPATRRTTCLRCVWVCCVYGSVGGLASALCLPATLTHHCQPPTHLQTQMWLHPDRYRTQICIQGTACTRKVCAYVCVWVWV